MYWTEFIDNGITKNVQLSLTQGQQLLPFINQTGVYIVPYNLDILPHPHFLNLEFLCNAPLPHLIFLKDIASHFPFSRYNLPHRLDMTFPFCKLDILHLLDDVPLTRGGGALYTPVIKLIIIKTEKEREIVIEAEKEQDIKTKERIIKLKRCKKQH